MLEENEGCVNKHHHCRTTAFRDSDKIIYNTQPCILSFLGSELYLRSLGYFNTGAQAYLGKSDLSMKSIFSGHTDEPKFLKQAWIVCNVTSQQNWKLRTKLV